MPSLIIDVYQISWYLISLKWRQLCRSYCVGQFSLALLNWLLLMANRQRQAMEVVQLELSYCLIRIFFGNYFILYLGGGSKLWRNLSFFVAFPAIGLCMLNCYLKEQEEKTHKRMEFVPYEHLRIRTKVTHFKNKICTVTLYLCMFSMLPK